MESESAPQIIKVRLLEVILKRSSSKDLTRFLRKDLQESTFFTKLDYKKFRKSTRKISIFLYSPSRTMSILELQENYKSAGSCKILEATL